MTSDQKKVLPFLVCLFALPLIMIAVRRKGTSSRIVYSESYYLPEPSSKAQIVDEYKQPSLVTNTESWEVVTDPKTGIPLKVIGHRRVKFG